MVDKLRKAMQWLWLYKERMILLIMVIALCNQVYQVLNPKERERERMLRAPRRNTEGTELLPPIPPYKPALDVLGNYSGLYNRNPFWFYSGQSDDDDGELDAERLGIYLLDIREARGKLRARIKTPTTTKWYDEGKPFEKYELQEIDEEEGTVVIWLTDYNASITLGPVD